MYKKSLLSGLWYLLGIALIIACGGEPPAPHPLPTLAALEPAGAMAGAGPLLVTFVGTGFVAGTEALFGENSRVTTYLSPTRVSATLDRLDLAVGGDFGLSVRNPAPGGGLSQAQPFTVRNLAPTLSEVRPATLVVGLASLELALVGTGYSAVSRVRVDGNERASTTALLSPTELHVTLSGGELAQARTVSLEVANPSPGGGVSERRTLTLVNPVPVLRTATPAFVTAGGGDTQLTLQGQGFTRDSIVRWNAQARRTVYQSSFQLQVTLASVDVATAGTGVLSVLTPGPGGGTSAPLSFEVRN